MGSALRWAVLCSYPAAGPGDEDHAPVRMRYCRPSLPGALPCLLADPPLASEE